MSGIDHLSEDRKELDKHNAEELAQFKSDVATLLGDATFRRYVCELLNRTGVFSSCFTGNSTTFYKEGRRDVGLSIFQDIMLAKPEAYGQILQEFYQKQKGATDG